MAVRSVAERTPGARFATLRKDRWWLQPLVTVTVLTSFVLYGLYVAFVNRDYFVEPYLSPFYSPCIASDCAHQTLPIIGDWWKISPALLVLPIPLGFRLTCYYYRKAYYRSFWWAPPACAVPDARGRYSGETRFPLILQNIHRYFFWLSMLVVVFLWHDAILAFDFGGRFGMGVGTLVLLVNAALLTLYSISCHSCRHLCGGHLDVFSKAPTRHTLWRAISRLNERHMLLAWISLIWVGLTDVYVRLLSMGVIRDVRLF